MELIDSIRYKVRMRLYEFSKHAVDQTIILLLFMSLIRAFGSTSGFGRETDEVMQCKRR